MSSNEKAVLRPAAAGDSESTPPPEAATLTGVMDDFRSILETERFLHQQIPLSRTMGVRLERFDADGLAVTAPLEPNHNHLGTAFGGSLAAVATLAGYTLLWLELEERDCHIVIQDSQMRFLAPVKSGIRAIAPRVPQAALEKFRRTFAKSGRARIALPIVIVDDGETCAEFTGTFVALR